MGRDDHWKGGLRMSKQTHPSAAKHEGTKPYPEVRLRALEMSDLNLLYEIENDFELADCTTNLMPLSRAALKQFIQQSLTHDIFALRQYRFVVEACKSSSLARNEVGETNSRLPVGFIDLLDFSPEHRRAEVGIAIFAPHRSQGYGAAALQHLAHWAHQQLSLVQLYAYVQEDNLPSHRLFQSAGFTATALLPSWFVKGGKAQDAHLFQLVFA